MVHSFLIRYKTEVSKLFQAEVSNNSVFFSLKQLIKKIFIR